MFELIQQFRAFFRLAVERKLTGSDQLMYLHLLNLFNEARRPETLRVKDAELKESMRLFDVEGRPASNEVLRRGRQRLKARGFIEFSSKGGLEPEYRLPPLYPAAPPAGTPAGTPAASGHISYTLNTEEVKENRDSRADAGAKCRKSVAEATVPNADTYAQAKPLSSPTSDVDANAIHEEWVKGFGKSLQGNQALELETLASKDYARAQVAIARTKAGNPDKPFAYFKAVYSKLTPNEVATQAPTKAIPPKYTDTTEQELMFGMRKEEDD